MSTNQQALYKTTKERLRSQKDVKKIITDFVNAEGDKYKEAELLLQIYNESDDAKIIIANHLKEIDEANNSGLLKSSIDEMFFDLLEFSSKKVEEETKASIVKCLTKGYMPKCYEYYLSTGEMLELCSENWKALKTIFEYNKKYNKTTLREIFDFCDVKHRTTILNEWVNLVNSRNEAYRFVFAYSVTFSLPRKEAYKKVIKKYADKPCCEFMWKSMVHECIESFDEKDLLWICNFWDVKDEFEESFNLYKVLKDFNEFSNEKNKKIISDKIKEFEKENSDWLFD